MEKPWFDDDEALDRHIRDDGDITNEEPTSSNIFATIMIWCCVIVHTVSWIWESLFYPVVIVLKIATIMIWCGVIVSWIWEDLFYPVVIVLLVGSFILNFYLICTENDVTFHLLRKFSYKGMLTLFKEVIIKVGISGMKFLFVIVLFQAMLFSTQHLYHICYNIQEPETNNRVADRGVPSDDSLVYVDLAYWDSLPGGLSRQKKEVMWHMLHESDDTISLSVPDNIGENNGPPYLLPRQLWEGRVERVVPGQPT